MSDEAIMLTTIEAALAFNIPPADRGEGRVYIIATAGCVKIGKTRDVVNRLRVHLSCCPLMSHAFCYVALSPVTSRYAELEQRIHGLCDNVGVARYGPLFSPMREYYQPDHPLFELLRNTILGEMYLRGLSSLLSSRRPALRIPRAKSLVPQKNSSRVYTIEQPSAAPKLSVRQIPCRDWSVRQWHAIVGTRLRRQLA